jgi:hypothetical protein
MLKIKRAMLGQIFNNQKAKLASPCFISPPPNNEKIQRDHLYTLLQLFIEGLRNHFLNEILEITQIDGSFGLKLFQIRIGGY